MRCLRGHLLGTGNLSLEPSELVADGVKGVLGGLGGQGGLQLGHGVPVGLGVQGCCVGFSGQTLLKHLKSPPRAAFSSKHGRIEREERRGRMPLQHEGPGADEGEKAGGRGRRGEGGVRRGERGREEEGGRGGSGRRSQGWEREKSEGASKGVEELGREGEGGEEEWGGMRGEGWRGAGREKYLLCRRKGRNPPSEVIQQGNDVLCVCRLAQPR